MNTANLQLEGLYAAIAALNAALRQKSLLSAEEIDAALARADATIAADAARARDLSPANLDAVYFPIRFLRAANSLDPDLTFSQLTTLVGQTKPDDGDDEDDDDDDDDSDDDDDDQGNGHDKEENEDGDEDADNDDDENNEGDDDDEESDTGAPERL